MTSSLSLLKDCTDFHAESPVSRETVIPEQDRTDSHPTTCFQGDGQFYKFNVIKPPYIFNV